MSARRQIIAALSEDSYGGIASLADVDHATQLVDAHRTEVLAAAAIDLLRERPKHANRAIFCDGITHAADRLTEWAKAGEKGSAPAATATPDAEAYDGELAMARSLLRTLRAVVRDDTSAEKQRAEVRQLLHEHASDEAAARAGGTA